MTNFLKPSYKELWLSEIFQSVKSNKNYQWSKRKNLRNENKQYLPTICVCSVNPNMLEILIYIEKCWRSQPFINTDGTNIANIETNLHLKVCYLDSFCFFLCLVGGTIKGQSQNSPFGVLGWF